MMGLSLCSGFISTWVEKMVLEVCVFMQNEDNNRTQLWTRTNSTEKHWTLEHLAIGKQQHYRACVCVQFIYLFIYFY